jgi:ketosteroid isomerase-like protein
MASANLELVRSIFAAWERGDFNSVEWADPEIEVVFADGPSPGTWRAVAGMVEGFRDFLGAWHDARTFADKYVELDAERVLALCQWRGRGKTSGLELGNIGTNVAAVLHVRGGKVTRIVLYYDRERALTDLGLPPERGSPK